MVESILPIARIEWESCDRLRSLCKSIVERAH